MEIDVLLPGGKWRGGTKKGFSRLEMRDIEDNDLAVLEEILPGSIPNIWSNALHFSWVLKRTGDITPPQEKAMNLLEIYLKGIFVQVLTIEKITLKENSLIKYLLNIHNPLSVEIWRPDNLFVLKYNNQIIAINYPECIFSPSAQNSAWPDDPNKNLLENEMIDNINAKFDELKEDGKEAYECWIQEILNKGIENPPWHKALLGKNRRLKNVFSEEMKSKLKATNELVDVYIIKAVNGKFLKDIINIPIRTYVPLGDGEIPDLNKIFSELSLFQGQIVYKEKIIITREECEQSGIVYIEKTDKTYAWQKPKNKLRGIIDIQYEADGFTLIFGKSIKNFKVKIINDDNFFVKEIFALKREISDPQGFANTEYLIPNLPIKEYEYCDLILQTKVKDVAQVAEEIKGQLTYEMDILGRFEVVRRNIPFSKSNEINPTLLIWPNFIDHNWNLYYIYNAIFGKSKNYAKLLLYFNVNSNEGSKKTFETIEGHSQEVIYKDKPPVAFSFSMKNNPCGIYLIEKLIDLKKHNESFSAFNYIKETLNSKRTEIGIDFGTSSTCISIREKDKEDILTLNFRTAKVLYESGKYASLNFVPEIPQRTIPSVLRVIPSLYNEEKYTEQAYSAYNFSPLIFYKEKLEEIPGQEIYRKLKWGEDKFKRSFLFLLFKHIFAEARSKGIEEIDFRISFPLAFDSHQLQNYVNLCMKLVQKLCMLTGIKSNEIGVISESEAGSNFLANIEKNKIVLDMGGETTDIYISSNDGVVIADSIRFAGGHILDSIIKKVSFLKDYEEKRDHIGDKLTDFIIFKLRGGVVKLDSMMDSENRGKALNNTSDGKEIIFEYVRRLLLVRNSKEFNHDFLDKVAEIKNEYEVFLIGRGWNLRVGEDILKLMQKYFDIGKYDTTTDYDPKEALAIGILRSINPKTNKITESFNDNDSDELLRNKITYVCAKCKYKAPKDNNVMELEWTDKIPFVCKSDIKLDQRSVIIELRLTDLYPNTIIKRMLNHLKGGLDRVNKVCYGKFNLSKTGSGDNAITASPFATMIENAFKEYLEI